MAFNMYVNFNFYDNKGFVHHAEIVFPPTDEDSVSFYIDGFRKDILAGSFQILEENSDELVPIPETEGHTGNGNNSDNAPAGDIPVT